MNTGNPQEEVNITPFRDQGNEQDQVQPKSPTSTPMGCLLRPFLTSHKVRGKCSPAEQGGGELKTPAPILTPWRSARTCWGPTDSPGSRTMQEEKEKGMGCVSRPTFSVINIQKKLFAINGCITLYLQQLVNNRDTERLQAPLNGQQSRLAAVQMSCHGKILIDNFHPSTNI